MENLTHQLEAKLQRTFSENLTNLIAKKNIELLEKDAEIARLKAEILWLMKQTIKSSEVRPFYVKIIF